MPQQDVLKLVECKRNCATIRQISALSFQFCPLIPTRSYHLQCFVQAQAKTEYTCTQHVNTTSKYSVYKSYHPLIGTPSWFPPLHVRVHMLSPVLNDMGDSETVETVYDLVPQNPTDISTVLTLLRGRCVPAVIRTKTRIQKSSVRVLNMSFVGVGHRHVKDVNKWVRHWSGCECDWKNKSLEYYDCSLTNPSSNVIITTTKDHIIGVGMRLVDRNCRHFAWELIQYMLSC